MPRKRKQRPRKPISTYKARLLPLIGFRYSLTRDAYVLRGVGTHVGPVYQVTSPSRLQLTAGPTEAETTKVG